MKRSELLNNKILFQKLALMGFRMMKDYNELSNRELVALIDIVHAFRFRMTKAEKAKGWTKTYALWNKAQKGRPF